MKQIKDFKDYYITEDGTVFSVKSGFLRVRKPSVSNWGYYRLSLHKDNTRKRFSVHRLVAEAFIENPGNKPEVNHINGNKLDNHVRNLEWVTPKENIKHATETGLRVAFKGINNPKVKLTEKEVLNIKQRIADGESNAEISKYFNVKRVAIWRIQKGIAWQHIGIL